MARIQQFKSLDEAAAFWDRHDFEDYVDDTEPVKVAVKLPLRKRTLTIPLELRLYERIEALAAKRGIGVEKLVSTWLKEEAMAGSQRR